VSVGALLPAAGRGERLGAGVPKALRPVRGEPLLVHAVRGLLAVGPVSWVVVAAPADSLAAVREVLDERLPGSPVTVVPGGASRQASVEAALAALPADVDVVLVHDAARAFAPVDMIERVLAAVGSGIAAVVPGLPVHDTVRSVGADGTPHETLDRDRLRVVQTPQGFARGWLEAAHRQAAADGRTATDDAALVEAIGGRVLVVPGSDEAFKVTRPLDLLLAEALLEHRAAAT
jgi:2-C-methyl-D-erythritol 4-phosphate cytidylyltransferase